MQVMQPPHRERMLWCVFLHPVITPHGDLRLKSSVSRCLTQIKDYHIQAAYTSSCQGRPKHSIDSHTQSSPRPTTVSYHSRRPAAKRSHNNHFGSQSQLLGKSSVGRDQSTSNLAEVIHHDLSPRFHHCARNSNYTCEYRTKQD